MKFPRRLSRLAPPRCRVVRLVIDGRAVLAEEQLGTADLRAGFRDAVYSCWRGKDFTAELRGLLDQVGQRPTVGREQVELLGDNFLVECHSEPLRSILSARGRSGGIDIIKVGDILSGIFFHGVK
jgi:hypothetical protein